MFCASGPLSSSNPIYEPRLLLYRGGKYLDIQFTTLSTDVPVAAGKMGAGIHFLCVAPARREFSFPAVRIPAACCKLAWGLTFASSLFNSKQYVALVMLLRARF